MAVWAVLGLFVAICAILAVSPFIVYERSSSELDDQKLEHFGERPRRLPLAPPYFKDDKVQFMNGGDKLHPGTVLYARDNPRPPKYPDHQMVMIRFLVDPKNPQRGFQEKELSSMLVVLIERTGLDQKV